LCEAFFLLPQHDENLPFRIGEVFWGWSELKKLVLPHFLPGDT